MNATTPTRARPTGTPHPLITLVWFVLIAAVFYICFFSQLDALGLVGPDEPRYAAIAREMFESGDWVTPRLWGKPWFEKPVLYYWSAALAFRIYGVNEFAARLPSALAAALAALGLAVVARRLYDAATALAVLLIFPTCIGAFSFARAATMDMLFSAALAGAMLTATAMIWSASRSGPAPQPPSWLARIGWGFFLGAAMLAKGPATIALAGGGVALWVLVTRRWRDALGLLHPVSIAAFCATALPWYALCSLRNPGFAYTFLFSHNIERYLTPVFHHRQPVWFFLGVLVLGLLPWTFLLIGAARDGRRIWQNRRWGNSPGFFLACWIIFTVAFFSLSESKLPGYVLPAVPALALLMARSFSRAVEHESPVARGLCVGVGASFVALAASAGHWLKRLPPESGLADPRRVFTWIAVTAAAGFAIVLLGILCRPRGGLMAAAALMAVLVAVVNWRDLPRLDPYLSPRTAARAAERLPGRAESLSVYRLPRAWHFGMNFYLRREIPAWNPQSSAPGWLCTSPAGLVELQRQGVSFTVAERASPEAWLVHLSGRARSGP